MNKHYVYIVFRPNGIPCYVGKGSGNRCFSHLTRTHNKHLQAIISKSGRSVPIAKIREDLSSQEASEIEIAIIAALGREADGGILVNVTIGGEGASGHTHSEETKARNRAAQLGKKLSAEHRAKLSVAQKGRIVSEATRSALAKTSTGRPKTQETRAKLSAAFTEERRSNLLARNFGNTYGIGNKRTAAGQAKVNAGVAASNRLRVATDEYREKRRKIAKAMWAKRKGEPLPLAL